MGTSCRATLGIKSGSITTRIKGPCSAWAAAAQKMKSSDAIEMLARLRKLFIILFGGEESPSYKLGMMTFERRHESLLPRALFVRRLARWSAVAGAVLLGSLALGICGYHFLEGLPWVDARSMHR